MSDNVPAGWYPDGSGGHRWWDGAQWTQHTQAGPDGPPPGGTAQQPAQPQQPTEPQQPQSQQSPSQQGGSYGQAAPAAGSSYEQMSQGYGGPAGGWQPAYGGGPEPTPKSRSKLSFIIGGAVAVVVVLALVLVFALGGGGKPEATVTKAFDALKASDCDGFKSTLAKDSDQKDVDCDQFEDTAKLAKDVDVKILSTKVDGDKATVEAENSGEFQGQKVTQKCTYSMVKEDGDWLIESSKCDQ